MEAMIKETRAPLKTQFHQSATTKHISNEQLLPIKRSSQAEMQERQEKKLCYYCDEKYEPGCKCKKRQIFLLEGDEGDDTMEEAAVRGNFF
ncbi:hypothetical protein WN943_010750 [Citrus x changshan-huyou]